MSHTYTKQEPMGHTVLDRIAELEAENAKLRAVVEAVQVLLSSCCEDGGEIHGMLEVEDALKKLETVE